MQVSKFNFKVTQFNEAIDVQLSIFKPDELTRYRAAVGGDASRIVMLYRLDNGYFERYSSGNWMEDDLAKKIADKIREKEVGGLLLHQLQNTPENSAVV